MDHTVRSIDRGDPVGLACDTCLEGGTVRDTMIDGLLEVTDVVDVDISGVDRKTVTT